MISRSLHPGMDLDLARPYCKSGACLLPVACFPPGTFCLPGSCMCEKSCTLQQLSAVHSCTTPMAGKNRHFRSFSAPNVNITQSLILQLVMNDYMKLTWPELWKLRDRRSAKKLVQQCETWRKRSPLLAKHFQPKPKVGDLWYAFCLHCSQKEDKVILAAIRETVAAKKGPPPDLPCREARNKAEYESDEEEHGAEEELRAILKVCGWDWDSDNEDDDDKKEYQVLLHGEQEELWVPEQCLQQEHQLVKISEYWETLNEPTGGDVKTLRVSSAS